MKIKYIWHDNPNVEKVYDTEIGYREHKHYYQVFTKDRPMSKQEWDEFELKQIEKKLMDGLVLSYEIIG